MGIRYNCCLFVWQRQGVTTYSYFTTLSITISSRNSTPASYNRFPYVYSSKETQFPFLSFVFDTYFQTDITGFANKYDSPRFYDIFTSTTDTDTWVGGESANRIFERYHFLRHKERLCRKFQLARLTAGRLTFCLPLIYERICRF